MQKGNNFKKSINFICTCIYNFFKYVIYGLISPIVFIIVLINKMIVKSRNSKIDKLNKLGEVQLKNAPKQEKKKLTKDDMFYKDDEVTFEKKNLGYYINSGLEKIVSIPSNISKRINNMTVVKQARNKKIFDTQTLLVDFSNEDKENDTEGKKVVWEYIARDQQGRKIKGYFEAFTRVDVQSFLLGEGLSVYSIRTNKTIQLLYGNVGKSRFKIKNKHLIFLLTQLSTYLKSGITLVESLNILIKQTKNKRHKLILREVTYDLTVGENFSSALEKRGDAFPKLLINMVKTAELTGELAEVLDDMVEYYTEAEAVRKEMVSAITYPTIVFVFTIAVLTFVMVYVVPQFVEIYDTMEASEIPEFTLIVISVSEYLKRNIFIIFGIIVLVILIIAYLYKNVKVVRTGLQWLFMHIPILKSIIIYNEVTNFSKTFASLLTHNVYITNSMDILDKITNNEIYKGMIAETVVNLARGEKISKAFENQWAFPVAAYEMIVTGERTGQLAEMMERVSSYYQSLHKNTVTRLKALLEPFLIVFLTFAVGIILISIIVPMFSMYNQVQSMG